MGRERLVLADSPESYQRSHIDWPLVPHYAQLLLPGCGAVWPLKNVIPWGVPAYIARLVA